MFENTFKRIINPLDTLLRTTQNDKFIMHNSLEKGYVFKPK
jgi:hypothetical protein